jgi:hypothetical protein
VRADEAPPNQSPVAVRQLPHARRLITWLCPPFFGCTAYPTLLLGLGSFLHFCQLKNDMDPVTAIGLACNVLDLVDKAIKCGKIVHKLYKDGFTDDQEDLETVADTMETVVTELHKASNTAKVRKSAMDPQIVQLLTRSTTLCASLRDLIKKCKPEKSGSWKAAGVAALKKLVHKSEIETLEKSLDTCRANLGVSFSAATQYGSRLCLGVTLT